jgi:hypothetical protein
MPPKIMCINRTKIKPSDCDLGIINLTEISLLDPKKILDNVISSENLLNKLQDWMSDQEPALLGVKPEEPIYLYVFDRSNSSSWRVAPQEWSRPVDLIPSDKSGLLKPENLEFKIEVKIKILGIEMQIPVQFPVVELSVLVPDMAVLERSLNYSRNGLAMAMNITAVNSLGEESPAWLPFPVWLPFPKAGHVVWDKTRRQVTVGFSERQSKPLPFEQFTNYLGQKAFRDGPGQVNAKFGQVRWYSLDEFPRMGLLHTNQAVGLSGQREKPCLSLPDLAAGALADLRRSGHWLYDEIVRWDDNHVVFNVPSEPGAAVIWRDDLPSRPIVCFDLLEYAAELAQRLWRPVMSSGDLDMDIPIPACQVIKLGVARLESAVNNELVQFIGNKLKVRFAFLVRGLQDDLNKPGKFSENNIISKSSACLGVNVGESDFQEAFEPGYTGVSTQTLEFRYQPQIADHEMTDAEAGAFAVRLNIIIEGTVTLLGNDLVIPRTQLAVGPELRFHPQPFDVSKLWQPVLSSGTLDLDIPIPVGEMVQLKVQRLEDAANNALTQFIGNGLKIWVAFLTRELKQSPSETSAFKDANFKNTTLNCLGSSLNDNNYVDGFDPGHPGISSSMLKFKYVPQIDTGNMTDASSGAFTLQLKIIIGGSFNLGGYNFHIPNTHLTVGPALRFHPKPLKIPTMAIFFEHTNFMGTALVALPSGTGLFGGDEIHVDAGSLDDQNQKRIVIINELCRIKDVLNLVSFVWDNQALGVITKVLGELCDIGRSIIDSSGRIENVSDCIIEKRWYGDANFNDAVSSAVVIGAPHNYTGTVIKCWEHSLRRADKGQCLRLMLPDGQFIAAVPFFSALSVPAVIPGLNRTVPLPYAGQTGPSPGIAGNNFNDILTAIEFVQEYQ